MTIKDIQINAISKDRQVQRQQEMNEFTISTTLHKATQTNLTALFLVTHCSKMFGVTQFFVWGGERKDRKQSVNCALQQC